RSAQVSVTGDARTLFFAGAVALLAGLLTGLAPVVQTRRVDVAGDLKAGALRRLVPAVPHAGRAARAAGGTLGGPAHRRGTVRAEPGSRSGDPPGLRRRSGAVGGPEHARRP